MLKRGFNMGKRLGLVIRNEDANPIYSTSFICSLFEEEGKDVFDVRPAILGHLQQGGDPSPFDRIQATRLARLCLEHLIEQCSQGDTTGCFIGLQNGKFVFHDMRDFDRMADLKYQRPRDQWWLQLKPIANLMAKLAPGSSFRDFVTGHRKHIPDLIQKTRPAKGEARFFHREPGRSLDFLYRELDFRRCIKHVFALDVNLPVWTCDLITIRPRSIPARQHVLV